MKAVNFGTEYIIYDESLKVYDQLPAQAYTIEFNQMSGFRLRKHTDIEITEDKVYGVHNQKVDKVLKSFTHFERNLGVILSGDKGIGKSLFAKMLCAEAVSSGYPVIIVDKYYPGIATYIESIENEVVIMFDEFDKTFGKLKSSDGEVDPQAQFLSLFDGFSSGKKLFVITCNNISGLNDYIINRPGRFHYHFRFEYPTDDEIRVYLKDKLSKEYYTEIEKVVQFASRHPLNYDCLRSIAFELNLGEHFESAVRDLNIINYGRLMTYKVTLTFTNHEPIVVNPDYTINNNENDIRCLYYGKCNAGEIRYNFREAVYDEKLKRCVITKDKMHITYDEDCSDDVIEQVKNMDVDKLIFEKVPNKSLHYVL